MSDIMIAGFCNGAIPPDSDHLAWTKLITNVRFFLALGKGYISVDNAL